jgi:hypothetical protein
VIGVHFLNIIVLFDRPFIGGSNLFGEAPLFRGGIVSFQAAFNISRY